MQYQITSDNIEMSPSMKSLAEIKLKKLENKLTHVAEDLKSARVVMNSDKDDQFLVKMLVTVKGKEYFAEEKGYTLEYALVETIDLIERELEKDKIISTSEDWKDAREAKRFDPTDTEEVSEEINA